MDQRYMGPMVVVRRTKGKSYLCCEMNGAMFHGKIAQFRVIPFEQRRRIEVPKKILDLIDLSKDVLEALAKDKAKDDKLLGKDFQFHKISIKRTNDGLSADSVEDDDSDTESYVSEEIPDIDLDEIRKSHTEDGPRRSKRIGK